MSIRTAISAFAHRGARRGTALQLLVYSVALTAVLLLLAGWVCARADEPPGGSCSWNGCPYAQPIAWSVLALADVFALALSAFALLVVAPAVVASAVAAERRAGTLDQLRTTPLSPLGLVGGLVIGAPAKLYLLVVGPLALHLLCGLTGVIPFDSMFSSLCVLVAGALASTLLGLAVALAPRQETGGALVALGVAALLGFSGLLASALASEANGAPWAFLHPAGALDAAMLGHDGLWRRLCTRPWRLDQFSEGIYGASLSIAPVLSVLSSLALSLALGAACCRKLAAPHLPLLSKRGAVALFVGVAAAVTLPLRMGNHSYSLRDTVAITLLFALLLLPLAALLGLFAAPTYEAWAQSLRRGKRVSLLHDDAAPHGAMWIMTAALAFLLNVAVGGNLIADIGDRQFFALLWAATAAATLPIFVHFLATRYATPQGRWAFGVAIFAHLLLQTIGIGLVAERGPDLVFVHIAVAAALLVPGWVVFRQRALRRPILVTELD